MPSLFLELENVHEAEVGEEEVHGVVEPHVATNGEHNEEDANEGNGVKEEEENVESHGSRLMRCYSCSS
ncbi:hypothetical protein, partial [Providencia stuartii]|uniref:hypothetical protein n=1 Tax=Providencia stuartii TaxID=588 RepID=UPI00195353C8